MKSYVRLEKAGKGTGYFLTIGDDLVEHRWAVTEEELKRLKEILNNEIELK